MHQIYMHSGVLVSKQQNKNAHLEHLMKGSFNRNFTWLNQLLKAMLQGPRGVVCDAWTKRLRFDF